MYYVESLSFYFFGPTALEIKSLCVILIITNECDWMMYWSI